LNAPFNLGLKRAFVQQIRHRPELVEALGLCALVGAYHGLTNGGGHGLLTIDAVVLSLGQLLLLFAAARLVRLLVRRPGLGISALVVLNAGLLYFAMERIDFAFARIYIDSCNNFECLGIPSENFPNLDGRREYLWPALVSLLSLIVVNGVVAVCAVFSKRAKHAGLETGQVEDQWSEYLFRTHSESVLSDWARRLKVFRFCRANGGHANDGDALVAMYRYESEEQLAQFLARIGLEISDRVEVDQLVHVSTFDGLLRLLISSEYEVTEENVREAERIEQLLAGATLPLVEPPIDNMRCVCPKYYPRLFDGAVHGEQKGRQSE